MKKLLALVFFTMLGVAHVLASTTTAQASSSVDWTTTGIFNPIKQRISVSITPQEKGYIKARVKLAKASETIWFDPFILTDSERQWMVGPAGIVNEAPQTAGGGGGSGVGGTSGFIYGP